MTPYQEALRDLALLRDLVRALTEKLNEYHDAKTDPVVDELIARARQKGLA